MFKHSVRVPRLYKIAAKIAKEVNEGIGSIKYLVYEHRKKHPNIKALYALVSTLFQRSDELECLLKRSQFFVKEPRADPWLSKILIIELLWGTKRLPGGSIPEITVKGYEQIFKAHMSDISFVPKTIRDTKVDIKPRYVRINTLTTSLNDAVEGFRNEGWNLCKFFDKTDYKKYLDKITSLAEDEFLIDIHVPDLLIFPPKTEFYNHVAYKNGSIILQDKASCLPVRILNPPAGSVVLDMCAAPGMKTTQVAAVMDNQGTIYAVERDPKRFATLKKIVESSGASCVKMENKDVLTCTADDFPGVQYIIVDPSCSGSGITDRVEFEKEKSKQRIEKLAGFQIKILRSALTRYPDVRRVVYSTCSIYPEENEDVVRQVLETNASFKLVSAKQFVNDTWQNFGSSDYGDIGKYCLYAKPSEDFTNGFFVAVFERLGESEENQFFNTKIYNYQKHVQSRENRKRRKQEDEVNVDTQKRKQTICAYENNSNDSASTHTIKEEMKDVKVELKKKKKKGVKDFVKNGTDKLVGSDKIVKEENKEGYVNERLKLEKISFNKNSETVNKEKTKNKRTKSHKNIFSKTVELTENDKCQQSQNGFEKLDRHHGEVIKYKKKKKKKEIPEEFTRIRAEINVAEETYNDDFSTNAQLVNVCKTEKKESKDICEKKILDENDGTEVVKIVDKKKRKSKRSGVDKNITCEFVELDGNKNHKQPHIDFEESDEHKCKKKKKKKASKEYTKIIVESYNIEETVNYELSTNVEYTSKKKKKTRELQNKSTKTETESSSEISLKRKKSKSREPQNVNHGDEIHVEDSADIAKKRKKKSKKLLDANLPNSDSNEN